MTREELQAALAAKYVPARVAQVHPEFLAFELDMGTLEDLAAINTLPHSSRLNPHNSALLYVLGITDVYEINKHIDTINGSWADIDSDFDTLDFDKVIDWLIEHYGRECVANILTFQKFKPKSSTHKYFAATRPKANDPNYEKLIKVHDELLYDILAKIPPSLFGKEATIAEVINGDSKKGFSPHPELLTDPKYKDWVEAAQKLEGLITSQGIHPSGVLIHHQPISNVVPIWTRKIKDELGEKKERHITQFTMEEVESLGLIKFDLLRIENLSIVKECIKLIKQRHDIDINPYEIPDGDEKTYSLLSSGYLAGLFQMEASNTMKEMSQQMKPGSLSELSDLSALVRPGPLSAGMTKTYIENKQNGYPPEDLHPLLADILKDTHYSLVYQEQVMSLVARMAGFDLRTADNVRRALGKKKKEVLLPYREAFINGCTANGITVAYATSYWDDVMVGLSDYLFNKSHSILYGYLTYICAYLKANYTIEFFAALLSVRSRTLRGKRWAAKAPVFINEAKVFNINISFPHINKSNLDFTIQGDSVYFGLPSIKSVSDSFAQKIIAARAVAPFTSLEDFISRMKCDTGKVKNLIKAGAFDCLGYTRSEAHDAVDAIYAYNEYLVASKERALENAQREIQNVELAALIAKRDDIRKRAKKKDYQLTAEEEEFLKANPRIMLKRELAPLEVLEPVKLTRSKKLYLTVQDIIDEGEVVGCYKQHPAPLIYPNTTRIADIDNVGIYQICGAVIEVKTYKSAKYTKHYLTIGDGSEIARIPVYAEIAPVKGDIIQARVQATVNQIDEETEEIKILKVYKYEIYKESN